MVIGRYKFPLTSSGVPSRYFSNATSVVTSCPKHLLQFSNKLTNKIQHLKPIVTNTSQSLSSQQNSSQNQHKNQNQTTHT